MKDYRIVRNVEEYRDGSKQEYYTIEVGYSIFGLFTYWRKMMFAYGYRDECNYRECHFLSKLDVENTVKELKDFDKNRYRIEPVVVGTVVLWRAKDFNSGTIPYNSAVKYTENELKTRQAEKDKITLVRRKKFYE